jgi:hypothetical protein
METHLAVPLRFLMNSVAVDKWASYIDVLCPDDAAARQRHDSAAIPTPTPKYFDVVIF